MLCWKLILFHIWYVFEVSWFLRKMGRAKCFYYLWLANGNLCIRNALPIVCCVMNIQKKSGELLSTDQHRSPYHSCLHLLSTWIRGLGRLAHTGITHLHWSFSVDQDVFSLSPCGQVCAICCLTPGCTTGQIIHPINVHKNVEMMFDAPSITHIVLQ